MVTFIIPTINRETLIKTLNSLVRQTNKNWLAIIIFDGVEVEVTIEDDRFIYITTNKQGLIDNDNHGQSGLVRNFGLNYLYDNNINTSFISFVDDDDTLHKNYVEEIIKNKEYDLLIARMKYENGFILPLTCMVDDIKFGQVGISFSFKKELKTFFDSNANGEDFFLLEKLMKKTDKIKIIEEPLYNVRH